SEHPLGKTIVAYARALGHTQREPEQFGYTPGLGIDAVLGGDLVLIGNQALMRAHDVAIPPRSAWRWAPGTDADRESADVVLLGNDLAAIAETLSIARRTRRIIWANFAGTLGVDAVGIFLAAFGLLNPLFAAFIHVASELPSF